MRKVPADCAPKRFSRRVAVWTINRAAHACSHDMKAVSLPDFCVCLKRQATFLLVWGPTTGCPSQVRHVQSDFKCLSITLNHNHTRAGTNDTMPVTVCLGLVGHQAMLTGCCWIARRKVHPVGIELWSPGHQLWSHERLYTMTSQVSSAAPPPLTQSSGGHLLRKP